MNASSTLLSQPWSRRSERLYASTASQRRPTILASHLAAFIFLLDLPMRLRTR